jgi:hypothetical protein
VRLHRFLYVLCDVGIPVHVTDTHVGAMMWADKRWPEHTQWSERPQGHVWECAREPDSMHGLTIYRADAEIEAPERRGGSK